MNPAGASVAIVVQGDLEDVTSRSGVPYGLAGGLRELGFGVRHVPAELPRVPRRIADRLLAEPEKARLRTLFVKPGLLRVRGVDGLVQVNAEFSVSSRLPLVTFDDMTIAQHVALGDDWVARRSRRTLDVWLERQRRAYERAVGCCVASRWAAESVVRDYGISPEKVRVIGRGHTHAPRPVDRDWSVPRLLFVGKDWERKNLPAVLETFAELRRAIPSARLDVVSRFPARDQEGVTFHGPLGLDVPEQRRKVEALFESATCFVMPSRHEAFGIVYTEAAAAGIASIGTAVGAAREIIGDAGRIVDPHDRADLLAAMRELADPETAQRLGALAAQRSSLFTWRAVAARVARALGLPLDPSVRPLAEYL
jgi:glycosyltransferase involved in cell wall biosynthesis